MGLILGNWRKRNPEEKQAIRDWADSVLAGL